MQAHRRSLRPRALPRLAAAGVLALAASAAGAPQSSEALPGEVSLKVQDTAAGTFGLAEHDGQLQAAGPDYRAVFEPGRFTYVPALGRTAPATMPVTFALEEVLLGDCLLYTSPSPRDS